MQLRSGVSAFALGLALALTLALPRLTGAANQNRGVAVAPGPGNQTGPFVSDVGAYGILVGWSDRRSGVGDIWFADVDSSGGHYGPSQPLRDPQSSYAGPPLAGEQALTPRNRGPWLGFTDGSSGYDLGIVHAVGGGYGGVNPFSQSVVVATGDQVAPVIHNTEAGRIIAAWQDGRLGAANTDIHAVGLGGVWTPPPAWATNPLTVCTAAGNQTAPVACTDGADGAIIAWLDARSGVTDIYAQRLNSAGVVTWVADGRPVCTAPGIQSGLQIVSDGAGGAILAWVDFRNGNADVYAQRLSPIGSPMWGPNGVPVCTLPSTQDGVVLARDFAGGCFLAWADTRNGQDIYVDHLNSDGLSVLTYTFGSNGTHLTAVGAGAQSGLTADSDSAGFYLAWEDRDGGDSDIHAAALDAGLYTMWDVVVCDAPGDQTLPFLTAEHSSRRGGAVVAWQDARISPTRTQIYAQRIRKNGALTLRGTDEPRIARVRDVPNDQGGRVALSFTSSNLDRSDNRTITEYRVWRRVAPTAAIVSGASFAGRGPDALRGRYLARPAAATATSSAVTTYWEAVATLAAQGLEGYAYTAATTQDSIAGANPYSAFFVTALTADAYTFYESQVDSGYSVDNLAPAMVQGFVGQGNGSTTALHWTRSAEPDFAVYRIHRGTSADFEPGPANLVAERPDTGYVDTAPGHHYHKLVAVDVHGNVGPAALVVPQVTNAVGDPRRGGAWLAEIRPNPVRREGVISYGLAREGDVTLDIFDIRGARVRRLVDGSQEPGDHVARWDGRNSEGVRVASGVYFYRLVTGDGSFSRRLMLAD